MKDEIIYRMIHEHDKKFCKKNCPTKTEGRCCPLESCEMVLKECSAEIKKLFDPSRGFLKRGGCVVPPEQRKVCTTFVCDVFADSKAFKGHLKLLERLGMRDRFKFKKKLRQTVALMRNMKHRSVGMSEIMQYLKKLSVGGER